MATWAGCPVLIVCLLCGSGASADVDQDKAAITERLQRWTAAFNARDSVGVCDLFAPDLVAMVPDGLDDSREALCSRLDVLLARPELQLHYDNPDIREIIVSGDIAVVRLYWTLTVQKGSNKDTTTEAGIDIFQRQQPDSRWSIARFLSFTTLPTRTCSSFHPRVAGAAGVVIAGMPRGIF